MRIETMMRILLTPQNNEQQIPHVGVGQEQPELHLAAPGPIQPVAGNAERAEAHLSYMRLVGVILDQVSSLTEAESFNLYVPGIIDVINDRISAQKGGQYADIEYPIEPVEILELGPNNEQEMGSVNEGEAAPRAQNLEEVQNPSPSSSSASSASNTDALVLFTNFMLEFLTELGIEEGADPILSTMVLHRIIIVLGITFSTLLSINVNV
ncbi:hypothetical protein ACFE04_008062 [Oxalis oulophora]